MIRVRIPPSPTGLLHIGTARTALYNYLFARHEKGQIVFRSEDTDKERSKKEYEDDIIHGLNLLGITWDEGPYRQSERTENYKKYLKELLKKDAAYYCFCSKERLDAMRAEQTAKKFPTRYDSVCSALDPKASVARVKVGESAVIRLRTAQDQELRFKDLIRGETVFSSKEFDDFVIARRLDDCLYNFTVVVDDHDMKITHVIRGEDHISNTPKQILIYRAFGWEVPQFAHLPLILNEDRTKMSKRKNKVSLNDYLAEGYLPEAIINFLALVGWSHPESRDILSMDELITAFDLTRVHHGGAIFDVKKLDWINGAYIKKAIQEDVDGFFKRLMSFRPSETSGEISFKGFLDFARNDTGLIKKILRDPDFEGRFKKLNDIASELRVFFEALPSYSPSLILNEKFKVTPEIANTVFQKAIEAVHGIDWELGDSAKSKILSDAMMALVLTLGLKNGQVLWPIRAALSGAERSPNFATLMVYLGKDETLKRLEFALKKL